MGIYVHYKAFWSIVVAIHEYFVSFQSQISLSHLDIALKEKPELSNLLTASPANSFACINDDAWRKEKRAVTEAYLEDNIKREVTKANVKEKREVTKANLEGNEEKREVIKADLEDNIKREVIKANLEDNTKHEVTKEIFEVNIWQLVWIVEQKTKRGLFVQYASVVKKDNVSVLRLMK